MNTVHVILDETKKSHTLPILRIVETGCESTIDVAAWCLNRIDSVFETADLDGTRQEANHKLLEGLGAASYCTFRTQDHKKFLSELSWIDVAFLRADNLQSGLEEFQLALSAGARVVVMKNFQANAALAVRQAQRFNWKFETAGEYSVLIRPVG